MQTRILTWTFSLKLILWIGAFHSLVMAQDLREDGFRHLAPQSMMAEDEHSEWKAEDVIAGKYDEFFKPVTEPIPNINFTTSTYWMKASFTHEGPSAIYYLECARPITNEVRYYELSEAGEIQRVLTSGDEIAFSERPINHRNILFLLEAEPGEQKQFLVAMRSDGEVINAVLKLWTLEGLSSFTQRENLFLGIYYGLLIFVLVIFGFFTVALKHRIYTYYVSYIFSLLLMQASLDGTAFQNLWPGFPWMANHSVLVFSSISVLLMMIYAAAFLKIQQLPKLYGRIYYFLGSIVALCVLTSMFSGFLYEWTFIVINSTSFFVLLTIIAGIFIKASSGQKVNRFFAIAFVCVLSSGLLFISGNLGLFFNEFLTTNAIKIGSAAEVVFLSLAMAGQYQSVQREKEEAQQEAYHHLETLNSVTQNQNVRLEQQVEERTAEIQEKRKLLEQQNKEIIDSITYAKRIQAAILPSNDFFHSTLDDAFVFYLPKDIVAGDFYWIKRVGERVLFAAADCTGHGVPGAMVSVICNSALNRAVREFGLTEPAAILDMTASLVEEAFQQSDHDVKDGMDISLGSVGPLIKSVSPSGAAGGEAETEHRELHWAGANNPLWIVTERNIPELSENMIEANGQRLYEVKADKQPIGQYANRKAYRHHQLRLAKGDVVYLFSDGFPDQFGGEKGKKYKSRPFKHFLLSIQDQSMRTQRETLEQEFKTWQGALEQVDDVCVIGVRI